MTNNQLRLREARETERSNLANEEIKRQQLSEEIANNLRNYKINTIKNQIQKLYNDQLNARELERLKNNLMIDLDKLSLEAVNNEIKRETNAIQKQINDAKNETALKTALIAGVTGLIGGVIKNSNDKDNKGGKLSDAQMDTIISEINKSEYTNNFNALLSKITNSSALNALINTVIPIGVGAATAVTTGAVPVMGFTSTQVANPSQINPLPRQQAWQALGKIKYGSKIPTISVPSANPPTTNSQSSSNVENNINVPSINETQVIQKTKSDYEKESQANNKSTSGGTNYTLSGGLKSTGTIIAPVKGG